jgi:hypothetical protein
MFKNSSYLYTYITVELTADPRIITYSIAFIESIVWKGHNTGRNRPKALPHIEVT